MRSSSRLTVVSTIGFVFIIVTILSEYLTNSDNSLYEVICYTSLTFPSIFVQTFLIPAGTISQRAIPSYIPSILFLSTGLVNALPSLSNRTMRVMKMINKRGELERTVFLPEMSLEETETPDQNTDENDRFVLISDSSQNKFKDPGISKKKVVKRRRRKKPTRTGISSTNGTNFKDPKCK